MAIRQSSAQLSIMKSCKKGKMTFWNSGHELIENGFARCILYSGGTVNIFNDLKIWGTFTNYSRDQCS